MKLYVDLVINIFRIKSYVKNIIFSKSCDFFVSVKFAYLIDGSAGSAFQPAAEE